VRVSPHLSAVVRYRIPPACLISSPRSMNTTGSSPATQAS
jgi:hypothetical protein